jgi:nitroimidazol reductase NimA-like FMN-containing flavoprotein (pyridoxamine 5'-phosphate oxidase superfamily)
MECEVIMSQFEITPLNKVRRPDRGGYSHEAVFAVLDEGLVAHVGFIHDGRPVVMPMAYARIDETLYIHGAKAARFAKTMGRGVPVCLTVTHTDGIVVARSAFHCSMNYRSAVVHGAAQFVIDPEEAEAALAAITDHLVPGRWAESRPMIDKELRATAVLRVEIEAASVKSRAGQPVDDEEDYDLPLWGGVIPVRQAIGLPQGDDRLLPGVELPVSVKIRAGL